MKGVKVELLTFALNLFSRTSNVEHPISSLPNTVPRFQ